MLSDRLIERYSRQILLPEVGGRGQERLCATTVVARGAGVAADFAATLLGAAGLHVVRDDGPPGRIAIALDGGAVLARAHDGGVVVATLVGCPCARCVSDTIWPATGGATSDPAAADAQACGALVAGETLRVALGLTTTGRIQAFDLARGTCEARAIPASPGCASCAETHRRGA